MSWEFKHPIWARSKEGIWTLKEHFSLEAIKTVFLRLLGLILVLALACLWVLLSATPTAYAQDKTINYSNTNLNNRDFSDADLAGAVFGKHPSLADIPELGCSLQHQA
ncbi:MAG: hypothetical protein LDL41_01765 [Coleofasciculus sp. S288]|nr:hypothetical protein [Coleofasciculus sp. S288]